MFRSLLLLALLLLLPRLLFAQDDGPPISITSPDTATTFAYGTIKTHTLIWYKKTKMLVARVTFTDAEQASGSPNEDTHEFRLPGVTLDEAKGVFSATAPSGEVIPVARYKKVLFLQTIETTANAVVRVQHPRGAVSVVLEAISPNDPSLHAPPPDTNPDGTHQVDINKIVQ